MTEQQKQDLDKMQSDAIRRMRDMSSRGQRQSGDALPGPDFLKMKQNLQKPQQSTPQKETQSPPYEPPQSNSSKGFNLLKMLNLNNFKMDSDFTIIIAMILLLSSEESDELLLLALLYIML